MGAWVNCQYCAAAAEKTAEAQKGEKEFKSKSSIVCQNCHGLGSIYTSDEDDKEEYEFVYDED